MQSLHAGSQQRRGPGTGLHPGAGCPCGRLGCDGCPLTPRTVYLLGAELAWLADVAEGDIADIITGRRSIMETIFATLPGVALAWGSHRPDWLHTYARAADDYEYRLHDGDPIDPRSLAEEILLHVAFQTVRVEPDPDGALAPAARMLPKLPGDYAWARAAERVGFRPDLHVLYHPTAGPLIRAEDPLHPTRWFEPYSVL